VKDFRRRRVGGKKKRREGKKRGPPLEKRVREQRERTLGKQE